MAKLNLVVGFTRLSEQRYDFTPLGAAGRTMPDRPTRVKLFHLRSKAGRIKIIFLATSKKVKKFTRSFHISKWQHYRRLGKIRRWMRCFYSTKFGSSRKQRPQLKGQLRQILLRISLLILAHVDFVMKRRLKKRCPCVNDRSTSNFLNLSN